VRTLVRCQAEITAGGDHGERQVVVDVGVHPGHGELEGCDRGIRPAFEQGRPGPGHTGGLRHRGGRRRQVPVGEHHVQVVHESGVGEEATAQPSGDVNRDLEVHAVEAGQAVAGR